MLCLFTAVVETQSQEFQLVSKKVKKKQCWECCEESLWCILMVVISIILVLGVISVLLGRYILNHSHHNTLHKTINKERHHQSPHKQILAQN